MTMYTINSFDSLHPYESPRMDSVPFHGTGVICSSVAEGDGTQDYEYGDTDDWFTK